MVSFYAWHSSIMNVYSDYGRAAEIIVNKETIT